MLKTNSLDGFEFNFIQIACLLKEIFQPSRRLVWDGFPYMFQVPHISFELDQIVCRQLVASPMITSNLEAFGLTAFLHMQLGDSERARTFVGGK
ncbi:MAG: hypothetical protein JO189_07105 [Deltaproteobacteria bacterium]|nr:hypothetical protein [Deltaproteobacteria bacterium]